MNPTSKPHPNPFPGLRPFREDEEHLFFGRENQVDAMVDKLAATHFLAVIGTSGSGKSSLVNCGLRPALNRGLMAGAGTAWRVAQFRPGYDPIGAMAHALAKDGVLFCGYKATGMTLDAVIETNLRMSKMGLIDIFEQASLEEGVNLLVVVDQFEELFRYRQPAVQGNEHTASEQAVAFVNLLLEIKERASKRIFIVLTMRSDFLGDCTQFPGLAEAINAGQYLVPRLTRDERRAAIEYPASVEGAQISLVLSTRLVNDVGDNPDQLSILQHALNRTWARWESEGSQGPVELAHYEAIGTMAHALDYHAERAYRELGGEPQQRICEKVFKALTDTTDPRGIRRPTAFGTLCKLAEATEEEVIGVIEVFRKPSRSFLMPPHGEPVGSADIIDVSHESLMRVWERLKKWTREEAQSARTYRRLAETAELYASGDANLWRDPELQTAIDWRMKNQPNEIWASRYHAGYAAAMEFLDKSSAEREKDRAEKERQRTRDLEAAREKAEIQARSAQRMRWAAACCFAVALVASFFWWQARQASIVAQESQMEMQITQSRALASAAAALKDPAAQVLLALEALPDKTQKIDRPVVIAAEEMLITGIHDLHQVAVLPVRGGEVLSVAITPKAERIVMGSTDNTARVWDGSKWNELRKHTGPVISVAISPDGHRIVTGSVDETARVWDGNGAPLFALEGHQGTVTAVAITPDGKRIATGGNDGSIHVWDGDNGAELFRLDGHTGPILDLAMTPNGKYVVSGSDDKSARFWGASSHAEMFRFGGHTGAVMAVAVSPDGGRVVTASADKTVRIWVGGKFTRSIPIEQPGDVRAVALSEHDRVVTASTDRTLRTWTGDGMGLLLEFTGHMGDVRAIAVSADGARTVSVSDDGTARIWTSGPVYSGPLEFDTPEHRQATIERAKAIVPRCLLVQERKENLLTPEPPAWCFAMHKYPYNTQQWTDLKAGKKLVETDIETAMAYGNFADDAIKAADFKIARDAAQLGIQFAPGENWIRMNLATADMFLNHVAEARGEYLSHRGEPLSQANLAPGIWEEAVRIDFKKFRKMGRSHDLMKEIEDKFQPNPAHEASVPAPNR